MVLCSKKDNRDKRNKCKTRLTSCDGDSVRGTSTLALVTEIGWDGEQRQILLWVKKQYRRTIIDNIKKDKYKKRYKKGVCIHWNGLLEWTTGMECWTSFPFNYNDCLSYSLLLLLLLYHAHNCTV